MQRALNALIALGVSISLSACSAQPPNPADIDGRPQNGLGWNGLGWNGLGWNGLGWNGLGWNGLGWNGLGWNGLGWNGLGWNGTSFSNLSVTTDWGLGTWVNDPTVGPAGREERLNGLAYWASCACAASDTLVWKGANPYTSPPSLETRSFSGGFDLAPTWCRGTGAVPQREFEAVSACLFSRVNTLGIHNALSIRGYENSLALIDNEKLFMSYPEAQYWGNLWNSNPTIQDPVTGLYYKNTRAFACYFPTGTGSSMLLSDLGKIVGRTCEFDGCGGGAHTSRECSQPGTVDGSYFQAYANAAGTVPVGFTADPAITATGANNSTLNDYQDMLTGTEKATYYQRDWRRLSVFLGAWADLETGNWKDASYQCSSTCGANDGCRCYDSYCSEHLLGSNGGLKCERPSACNNCQTIVRHPGWACGTDVPCKTGECVRDQKLASLVPGCWLNIQFTRPYDLVSGTQVSGNANPHKSGTLLFRYSHVGPGPAAIQIKDMIRNIPIVGGLFEPTGSTNIYKNQLVYPIYPGRATFTGALPGIEIAITGDPAYAFPELDYAQIFVGPPPDTKPRELYWTTKALRFNAGDTACLSIDVDSTTDISKLGQVRIRPLLTGVLPEKENITVTYDGVTATYKHDGADSPWSLWMGNFINHSPTLGDWKICVDGASDPGTFEGAYLEIEQR